MNDSRKTIELKLVSHCIICGEKIELPEDSANVPYVCEECKEAVLYQRRFLQAIDDWLNRKV